MNDLAAVVVHAEEVQRRRDHGHVAVEHLVALPRPVPGTGLRIPATGDGVQVPAIELIVRDGRRFQIERV